MNRHVPATSGLESRATNVPESIIRKLANAAMHRPELISLWFGESNLETPGFIKDAAIKAIQAGESFYSEGLGRPFLREAIAKYTTDLYGVDIPSDRVAVTVSGLNALNLAFQCVLEEGDLVVTPTPTWPNILSVPALQGARVETQSLSFGSTGWGIDLEQFLETTAGAKCVLINSPANPTGWMMNSAEQRYLLETMRERGTWLIADEVYARLCFSDRAAPSFLEVAEPEDRLIVINSFSKSWAMTGWRLGWLTLPSSLTPVLEKIIEFSVSCAPPFTQRAGVAALEHGEQFVQQQVYDLKRSLNLTEALLTQSDRIEFHKPAATFYAYFRVDGVVDGIAFAKKLIDKVDVGIAPGVAFDRNAENWFRLCFAKSDTQLTEALSRILLLIT